MLDVSDWRGIGQEVLSISLTFHPLLSIVRQNEGQNIGQAEVVLAEYAGFPCRYNRKKVRRYSQ